MASKAYFSPRLFTFLRKLKRQNNREWFQSHKSEYEEWVKLPFLEFITDFQPRLNQISPHFIADNRPSGGSLLRVYKDLRFRPDAPPYKTMAAARFPHSAWKKTIAPGFYLHLEPAKSFFAGGLWHPDTETRAKIRTAILTHPSHWKKAVSSKAFKSNCILSGEFLQRLPSGIDQNHPLAEDLKRKDFIMYASFTDKEVSGQAFMQRIVTLCRASAPFMEFLVRTLDLPWSSGDRQIVRDVAEVDSFVL